MGWTLVLRLHGLDRREVGELMEVADLGEFEKEERSQLSAQTKEECFNLLLNSSYLLIPLKKCFYSLQRTDNFFIILLFLRLGFKGVFFPYRLGLHACSIIQSPVGWAPGPIYVPYIARQPKP